LFNQENDNESDFCESYKSQVLGANEEHEEQSLFSTLIKLVTILILLLAIGGISFYGYHYFTNNRGVNSDTVLPLSAQTQDKGTIDDEELVVTLEEPKEVNVAEVPAIKEIEEPKVVNVVQVSSIKEVEKPKVVNVIHLPITKEKVEEPEIEKLPEVKVPKTVTEETDIDKMANAIKIEIAKSEIKEEQELKAKEKLIENRKSEASLKVPSISTSAPEAQYLEELAKLSNEIDKDRNK